MKTKTQFNHPWIAAAIASLLFATLGTLAQQVNKAELQYRDALNKEQIQGDLNGAIKIYQRIADSKNADKAVRAKALLQLAGCYEKLGKQAESVYLRIVNEFADQPAAVQAKARLAGTSGATSRRGLTRVLSGSARWAAVTPDGRYLLSGDSGGIYDLTTGKNAEGLDSPNPLIGQVEDSREGTTGTVVLSPDGKQVAYTFDRLDDPEGHRTLEVRIRPFKGNQPKVLVRSAEYIYYEVFGWSSDGKDVFAVVTRKDQEHQIVRIRAADGSVRSITSLEWRWPGKLSVSPDGRYIAYDAPVRRDSTDRDIVVLAADGSSENTIVQNPARDTLPVWSPDGGTVIFLREKAGPDDSWALWGVRVAEGKAAGMPIALRRDPDPLFPLGFTRDGTFYYERVLPEARDLYTANVDMATGAVSDRRRIEHFPGRNFGAAYAPDGRQMAYFSLKDSPVSPNRCFGGNCRLLALVIRSLESADERDFSLMATALAHGGGEEPTWFPDSQSIVFISLNRDNEPYVFGSFLHRIDVKTGEELIRRRIEGFGRPAVSPDGKRIYFQRNSADLSATIFMAYDTSTEQEAELFRLPRRSGAFKNLSYEDLLLSPTGQEFAFTRRAFTGNGFDFTLNVVPLSGASPRELRAPGAIPHIVAWSSDGKKLLVQTTAPVSHLWWVPTNDSEAQTFGTFEASDTVDSIHPDGRRIAYTRQEFANFGSAQNGVWADPEFISRLRGSGSDSSVFTADITREGQARGPVVSLMQSSEFSYWAPLWSPDGQTLEAKRKHGGAPKDLHDRRKNQGAAEDHVLHSMTGEEKILQHNVSPRPVPWFRDGGGWLGIRGMPVGCDLCITRFDLAAGTLHQIAKLEFPTWPELMQLSPDDKIIYAAPRPLQGTAGNNMVAIIDVSTGKEIRRLMVPISDEIEELALSPDGRTLAMWSVADPKTGQSHLFRIGVDGSGYRELYRGHAHSLAWTPDSRSLFFAKSDNGEDWQVMRIPADGGKEQSTGLRVKNLQYISLSPDGTRLAFDGDAPGISSGNVR
jgi:Tol biopolymer transport system component